MIDPRHLTRRQALAVGAGGALSLWLAACGGQTGPNDSSGGGTAGLTVDAPVENQMLLANWVDFTNPENLEQFAREHSLELTQDGYGSQEELLAKLGAGGSRFDVVCPGTSGLRQMIDQDLALKLTPEMIPNLHNIKPAFRDAELNHFGVPKDFGLLSFFWRTDIVKEQPRTLLECFELLPRYRNARVNFIESGDEIVGTALAALGLSVNSEDDGEIARVRDLLLKVKPAVDQISTQYIERGSRGEIDFGLGYSGDVRRMVQARARKDDEMVFLVPEGSAERFVDYWVIPAAAQHPVAAHKFLNFMLDPRVAAREQEYIQYGTPVAGVERFVEAGLATDPTVAIPEERLRNYQELDDLGPRAERQRARLFTEFKAA